MMAIIKLFTAVILNFGASNFHPSQIFLHKGGSLLRGTSLVSSDLALKNSRKCLDNDKHASLLFKVSLDRESNPGSLSFYLALPLSYSGSPTH